MINKLIDLNFAPGIKAKDINYNFDLIHDWITKERLRIGGYGLVEGFDLSANLKDFSITVSEGILINQDGEEVIIPEQTFTVGPPEYTVETEEIICPASGIITLKYRPYSEETYGYIEYIPPNTGNQPQETDISANEKTTGMRVPIMQLIGNKIYINANSWENKTIKVTYKRTQNRIDSLMLYKNGEYEYEKSIPSTSPSHVDLGDYINYFCVGIIYWNIDTKITVDFFINHRSYRKVYVDKDNNLYLNGELYKKPKFIYFEEPENPEKNDLWYDSETNTIYIWKETDGDFGWVAINDFSTLALRDKKIWTIEDFPEDAQTFMFNDDETNLFYVPDTSALEIIIDNVPLMSDQFDEIIIKSDKDYLSNGRGFRLKDPLDRPTYVECIVHHCVRNKPVKETFQRAAIFIDENYIYYSPENINHIFQTDMAYVIGEDQLEVFVNGLRLNKDIDFIEMISETIEATESDRKKMTTYFKIKPNITLNSGDIITYKISKHVWSYDHLDVMMHEIENKADQAISDCTQLKEDLSELNDNVYNQLESIEDNIQDHINLVGNLDDYLKTDSILTESNLPETVKNKMISGQQYALFPSTDTIILSNTKITDFIIVTYISERMNRNLIKDTEYFLTQIDNDIRVDISGDLMASDANIYIQILKVGEH